MSVGRLTDSRIQLIDQQSEPFLITSDENEFCISLHFFHYEANKLRTVKIFFDFACKKSIFDLHLATFCD